MIYVDMYIKFFFFQAEDGIRDWSVTGVQTCALPIYAVGGGRSTSTDDMPKASDAQLEADRIAALGVMLHQLLHAAARALGDDDEGVRLAALVGGAQPLRHLRGRDPALGQRADPRAPAGAPPTR